MKFIKIFIVGYLLSLTACGSDTLTGRPGKDGDKGHSAVFSKMTAHSSLCANGGYVLTYGVDLNDDAELEISETSGAMTVCNGMNGTDPTPVAPIKLCPDTTAYPSVFVEYAFCLNNKLYGVYSANGGFLAYLPEGTYHSNAIGSSCNLTVQANCVVVH